MGAHPQLKLQQCFLLGRSTTDPSPWPQWHSGHRSSLSVSIWWWRGVRCTIISSLCTEPPGPGRSPCRGRGGGAWARPPRSCRAAAPSAGSTHPPPARPPGTGGSPPPPEPHTAPAACREEHENRRRRGGERRVLNTTFCILRVYRKKEGKEQNM